MGRRSRASAITGLWLVCASSYYSAGRGGLAFLLPLGGSGASSSSSYSLRPAPRRGASCAVTISSPPWLARTARWGKEEDDDADGIGDEDEEDEGSGGADSATQPLVGGLSELPKITYAGNFEGSLAYRSDNGTRDDEFYLEGWEKDVNPYFDVVRRLSPTELIGRFMRTSPQRVQDAVRTTVLGLLGSLPRHAFETTALSTGDALANLMFQLQITGYLFKNAEYRLSLQSSLRESDRLPALMPGMGEDEDEDDKPPALKKPKIEGKIKVSYEGGPQVEVDAEAYMAELSTQVEKLEKTLTDIQRQRDEAANKDLLLYIKSMPENQLKGMTENVSPEVLEGMKMLVDHVLSSMGNDEVRSRTLTQQTGSGMAQLCMWQLIVGYSLRELEAREEIRKKFEASSDEPPSSSTSAGTKPE